MINAISRMVRAAAFDVVARRDGQAGWKRGRNEFRVDAAQDAARLQAGAESRLERILRHAQATSPYYRESFRSVGITDAAMLDANALTRLPFVTKDIIRERREDLRSAQYPEAQLLKSTTGGTTGVQTTFYLDKACALTRVGRQWGILESLGYSPGMRRGLVWGVHADVRGLDAAASLKRRFRRFGSGDEVMCCTVMSDELMSDYHGRLRKFRPEVLYAYPSALARFGAFIQERGLAPIRVDRIFTTAERLTPQTRAQLTDAFGGEVFNLYCTREYGCIAFECSEHRGMHLDIGSGFIEICDERGPVPPGESGEIVMTDLLNRGMPLIRSRTADYGSLSTEPCPCGSPFPLLASLDGRSTHMVHLPDGSTVAGLMLADLFTDLPAVRIAQFVQHTPAQLRLLLVLSEPLTPELTRAVIAETRTIVGSQIHIDVEQVDDLPRNPRSGKIPEVISYYDPLANGG